MTDVGRGVTKDRCIIYTHIYIYISLVQFIPVYVRLAQARPNYALSLTMFDTGSYLYYKFNEVEFIEKG